MREWWACGIRATAIRAHTLLQAIDPLPSLRIARGARLSVWPDQMLHRARHDPCEVTLATIAVSVSSSIVSSPRRLNIRVPPNPRR